MRLRQQGGPNSPGLQDSELRSRCSDSNTFSICLSHTVATRFTWLIFSDELTLHILNVPVMWNSSHSCVDTGGLALSLLAYVDACLLCWSPELHVFLLSYPLLSVLRLPSRALRNFSGHWRLFRLSTASPLFFSVCHIQRPGLQVPQTLCIL